MRKVDKIKTMTKKIHKNFLLELSKTEREFTGRLKMKNGTPQFEFNFVEPIKLDDEVWNIAGCTLAKIDTYVNSYTGKSRQVTVMAFNKIVLHDNDGNQIKLSEEEYNNITNILENTTKIS